VLNLYLDHNHWIRLADAYHENDGSSARERTLARRLLDEQHRIVAGLDAMQAQVDALMRVQAETTAELDALLPSILSKAFNGEL
jgi:hypothetical protein